MISKWLRATMVTSRVRFKRKKSFKIHLKIFSLRQSVSIWGLFLNNNTGPFIRKQSKFSLDFPEADIYYYAVLIMSLTRYFPLWFKLLSLEKQSIGKQSSQFKFPMPRPLTIVASETTKIIKSDNDYSYKVQKVVKLIPDYK